MNTMRNFLLMISTVTVVSGFVTSNHGVAFSSGRIQQAAFVAASPAAEEFATKEDVKVVPSTIPSGPSRAKITTINSPEEYEKFLAEDDRLTLVRYVDVRPNVLCLSLLCSRPKYPIHRQAH